MAPGRHGLPILLPISATQKDNGHDPVVVVKATLIDEYDALTIRETELAAELERVRTRRQQLRETLFGERKSKPDTRPTVWQRLGKEPPLALEKVIEVVERLGRATNAEIAKELGIPVQTASLRLSRAVKEGFLRRVAQGTYVLEEF